MNAHILYLSQITLWVFAAALAHSAKQTTLLSEYCVVCFPLLALSLMPLCPCNPSESWALMHRLPYFSTEMTVACRERLHIVCTCVRACICAIFGRLPVFSLHQRSGYGSLLGPFLLRLDHIPQNTALVGNTSVFFPAIVKKTNSLTVCVGPGLTITGPLWVAAGYSKNQHLLYPRLRLFNVQIQFLPRTLGLFRGSVCIVLNSLSPDLQFNSGLFG